ncbi:MAG TPA: hypothetical protein VFQ35_02905 [Polyangiaceae bacterium]|nr:hypothetical protein [Polyangiaceae bacterium]
MRAAWLSSLALLWFGCAPPSARPESEAVAERVSPARVDLSRIRLGPGVTESTLELAGGGARSVLLWQPEGEPNSVIVFLHGAVPVGAPRPWRAPAQTRGLVECLAVPAFAALRPIILLPRSERGEWWSRADAEFVLGLLEAAVQRWPTAAHRKAIVGYSNGGIGTWYFARAYPTYFDAAIPMASNDTVVGATRLPVFAIHGENDELFSIERVRSAIEALKSEGQDVTLLAKYRGTHLAPCGYVDELGTAARWLSSHVWH